MRRFLCRQFKNTSMASPSQLELLQSTEHSSSWITTTVFIFGLQTANLAVEPPSTKTTNRAHTFRTQTLQALKPFKATTWTQSSATTPFACKRI